jgi:hypothetical protein
VDGGDNLEDATFGTKEEFDYPSHGYWTKY